MKKDKFTIACDLGVANGSFTAYGCDLGYDNLQHTMVIMGGPSITMNLGSQWVKAWYLKNRP
mgnify:CR=1 FL=1